MGKGGSGASNQTVTTNLLPDYAQPYVIAYLNKMSELSDNAYATYPGATYAIQNADELEGIAALADRGRNGSPLVAAGYASIQDVLDGFRFNTNTKIDEAYVRQAEVLVKEFEEETLPVINQFFNMRRSYGAMSHSWAQAKAAEKVMAKLQSIGMDLYFKDYVQERTLQIGNLDDAIVYGDQSAADSDTLRQAGELQREWQLGKLEDDYKKWHDETTKIIKRLEIIGNGLRTVVGAQHEVTEPFYRPSAFSAIAGLALAGAGMYAMYKGSSTKQPSLGTKAGMPESLTPNSLNNTATGLMPAQEGLNPSSWYSTGVESGARPESLSLQSQFDSGQTYKPQLNSNGINDI